MMLSSGDVVFYWDMGDAFNSLNLVDGILMAVAFAVGLLVFGWVGLDFLDSGEPAILALPSLSIYMWGGIALLLSLAVPGIRTGLLIALLVAEAAIIVGFIGYMAAYRRRNARLEKHSGEAR